MTTLQSVALWILGVTIVIHIGVVLMLRPRAKRLGVEYNWKEDILLYAAVIAVMVAIVLL